MISMWDSTSSWKPLWWMRFDLIFMMKDMYINSNLDLIKKFCSRSGNAKSKDPSLECLTNDQEDIPVSMAIFKNCALKRNMPFGFERKWMDTEATTWPDEKATTWGKSIVEQILGSEEYIKSKRVVLWESQIWIHVWMLTIGVKWFETKKNEFPWWISSSGISLPVILMDLRWIKSPKINTVTVVG